MQVNIFVSYSHRDDSYLAPDELLGFLRGLERDEDVRFWVDTKLAGGDRWDDEIRTQLERAHIALVLVSQSFLDSVYCRDVEVAEFLKRRRDHGLQFFPVLLSACEWERHAWLSEHQMLPGGDETIEESYTEPGLRKRMYLRIRKELRALAERVRQQSSSKTEEEAPRTEALAERRRVTLVHCLLGVDRTGTLLDEQDEMEVLYEALPSLRERFVAQIQSFGGSVVSITGAASIACFGYPEAREDESVRALRAALGIVEAVRILSDESKDIFGAAVGARIGLQTGIVISSSGATAQEQLQGGDTNLIAGHLAYNAPLHGIVVGDVTHRLVRRFFAARQIYQQEHEGLRRVIKGWQILSDLGMESRFEAERLQGLTAMVGRESELNLAMDAWRSARSGSGRIVCISGEAGLGKSRLLEEVRRRVARHAHRSIELHCSTYHSSSALYAVAQAVAAALYLMPAMSNEEKLETLTRSLHSVNMGAVEVQCMAELLGLATERERTVTLSAQQLKERTFETILHLLLDTVGGTPTLMVVEDLHWIDPSTEELLGVLVEELHALPILIVCTMRPEYQPPSRWAQRDEFVSLRLGQLSRAQVQELIRTIAAGKPLPAEMVHAICERTEGYPLFVEDLTRTVLESDILEEHNDVYVLKRGMQAISIPETLQDALMARLNKVESAKLVAQLGAVVGRDFSLETIRGIAPLEEPAIRDALNKLLGAGILVKRGLLSRTTYRFKHALIQEALYESLLKRERRRYHKLIAQLLEQQVACTPDAALLAHHSFEAGDCEAAARYWLQAGTLAIRNYANLEALRHATQALQAIATQPETLERDQIELDVLMMQGPALLAVRGWAATELGRTFERVREIARRRENVDEVFRAARGLWDFNMVRAQLSISLAEAAELLRIAEQEDRNDYRLEAYVAFCDSNVWSGFPRLAADYAERALALSAAERDEESHHKYGADPRSICLCYGPLANYLAGNLERASALLQLAKDELDSLRQPFSRAFVLNGIGWYGVVSRDPVGTLEYSGRLLALCDEFDLAPWRLVGRAQLAWARAMLGADPDTAIAEINAAQNEWQANGAGVTLVLNAVMVAEILLHRDRAKEALEHLAGAITRFAAGEERHLWPELHRLHGEALARLDPSDQAAKESFETALALAERQQASTLAERARASLSHTLGPPERTQSGGGNTSLTLPALASGGR